MSSLFSKIALIALEGESIDDTLHRVLDKQLTQIREQESLHKEAYSNFESTSNSCSANHEELDEESTKAYSFTCVQLLVKRMKAKTYYSTAEILKGKLYLPIGYTLDLSAAKDEKFPFIKNENYNISMINIARYSHSESLCIMSATLDGKDITTNLTFISLLYLALTSIYTEERRPLIEMCLLQGLSQKNEEGLTELKHSNGLYTEIMPFESQRALRKLIALSDYFSINMLINFKFECEYQGYYFFTSQLVETINLKKEEYINIKSTLNVYYDFQAKENHQHTASPCLVRLDVNGKSLPLSNYLWPEIMNFVFKELYYQCGEKIFTEEFIRPYQSLKYSCESGLELPARTEDVFVEYKGCGSANCVNVIKKLVTATQIPITIEFRHSNFQIHRFELTPKSVTYRSRKASPSVISAMTK